MNFELSEDQIALRDSTLKFSVTTLKGTSASIDNLEFPRQQWDQCAEFGLLGVLIPEEYGGMGRDCLTAQVILEALGYGCRDHGLVHAICTQIICSVQIMLFGTAEQKSQFLPAMARGEIVACQAMTEPDAGSDTLAIRTRAEWAGVNFKLNGRKTFISNAPMADIAIVFAVTDASAKTIGRLSCFLVPSATPGLSKGPAMHKMGLNSLQNGDLILEDCEVDRRAILGRLGAGSVIG
jgi:alkylation response protein AidB-like acyl-CoA dehydrogenase